MISRIHLGFCWFYLTAEFIDLNAITASIKLINLMSAVLSFTICNRRERWSFSLKPKKTTRWGVPEQECLISYEWGFVCFIACTIVWSLMHCRFHWGKESRGAFCCTEGNPQMCGYMVILMPWKHVQKLSPHCCCF